MPLTVSKSSSNSSVTSSPGSRPSCSVRHVGRKQKKGVSNTKNEENELKEKGKEHHRRQQKIIEKEITEKEGHIHIWHSSHRSRRYAACAPNAQSRARHFDCIVLIPVVSQQGLGTCRAFGLGAKP